MDAAESAAPVSRWRPTDISIFKPGVIVSVALLCSAVQLAHAQSSGALSREVKELADKLANLSDLTDGRTKNYLLAEYGVKFGADIAEDQIKGEIRKATEDGQTRNLKGHLQRIDQLSVEARSTVEAVNATITGTPDYSQLDYCSQASASEEKIADIKETVRDLRKLAELAKSYLRVLPALDQMTLVLYDYWNQVYPLAAVYDATIEETTVGTMYEQWVYFTWADGDGEPSASYQLNRSRENWQAVERLAGEKAKILDETIATREAFHSHFYEAANSKCNEETRTAEDFQTDMEDLVAGIATNARSQLTQATQSSTDQLANATDQSIVNSANKPSMLAPALTIIATQGLQAAATKKAAKSQSSSEDCDPGTAADTRTSEKIVLTDGTVVEVHNGLLFPCFKRPGE